MAQVWMVRAGESEICDEFQQKGYVGIDFEDETNFSSLKSPEEFRAFSVSRGLPTSGHGFWQTSRFIFEMQIGDRVITYNKRDRVYLVGELAGPYQYLPKERRRSHARLVHWIGQVSRDSLSVDTKSKLGSTLTIFNPSESACADIERVRRSGGRFRGVGGART
jgi:restriction system protein